MSSTPHVRTEELGRRQCLTRAAVLHGTIDDKMVVARAAEHATEDAGGACRELELAHGGGGGVRHGRGLSLGVVADGDAVSLRIAKIAREGCAALDRERQRLEARFERGSLGHLDGERE